MTYDLNAAVAPAVDATGKLTNTCTVEPLCTQFGRTASTSFLFKPTSSNYHALQARFDHKWASGFILTTSYTFGKALAYRSDAGDGGGNDGGGPSYYLDFRRNYMVVSFSRTHTFTQSAVYELPFGRGKPFLKSSGWANWVVGGWQVSGILTLMSGRPLDFSANGNLLNAPGTRQTPNQIAPFHVLGGLDTAAWFDTTAFAAVTTPGVVGNLNRFAFTGPRFYNLDTALLRRFSVTERVGLEFRAEAFSVTNTPQFDQPSADFNNPNFGHIKGTIGGTRTMELGAKITF